MHVHGHGHVHVHVHVHGGMCMGICMCMVNTMTCAMNLSCTSACLRDACLGVCRDARSKNGRKCDTRFRCIQWSDDTHVSERAGTCVPHHSNESCRVVCDDMSMDVVGTYFAMLLRHHMSSPDTASC